MNEGNEGESVGTSLPLPESLDERCTSQPSEHGPQETVLEESERARLHAAIGEAAMISGEHGSGLKLPWESGGFALIFGAQKTVDFEVPEVPFPVVAPGASQDTAEKLTHPAKRQKLEPCGAENFRRVINFKQAFDDETLDQNKWARALEKWYTILGENWASSLIGFKISKLPAEEGVKRIRELFGKKSVATVDRRANSLLGYISWGHKAHPGVDIFPLCTWMLDEHLEWLQHNKTKISAMHSFRESINFCHFVVGVEVSATCKSLWSPWAKGLLGMRDLERSERKQSAVLTVGQVAFLELLLDDDSVELMDRYAAGVMLFAVYSRSRCSDLKVVEGFILDTANVGGNQIGFIECKTRSHKSSRQVAQQGLAMPLIAPIMGVRNVSWGLKFIEVAKAVGLGLEGRAKGPLLPAPTEAGEWSKRAVTSGEMSRWLQVLLKDEGNSAEVSSHSLKSTSLSWCSKFGMSRHPRLQLGHHSTGDGTLNTYGRDFLAPALREYITVAEHLRTIKRQADGSNPLDGALPNVLADPAVSFHLLPLAIPEVDKASPNPGKQPWNVLDNRGTKRQHDGEDQAPKPGKGFPKGGGGKGGGKGKNDKLRVPKLLIGKWYQTREGERLCWAFNLPGGCDKAKAGEKCDRGWHLCAEPNCLKAHSLQDHRS